MCRTDTHVFPRRHHLGVMTASSASRARRAGRSPAWRCAPRPPRCSAAPWPPPPRLGTVRGAAHEQTMRQHDGLGGPAGRTCHRHRGAPCGWRAESIARMVSAAPGTAQAKARAPAGAAARPAPCPRARRRPRRRAPSWAASRRGTSRASAGWASRRPAAPGRGEARSTRVRARRGGRGATSDVRIQAEPRCRGRGGPRPVPSAPEPRHAGCPRVARAWGWTPLLPAHPRARGRLFRRLLVMELDAKRLP